MPLIHQTILNQIKATNAVSESVADIVRHAHLTFAEWLCLSVVVGGSRSGLRMFELADQLGVTLPQLSATVVKLVDKKMCKSTVDTTDRRGRRIHATLKGKRMAANLEQQVSKYLTSHIDQDEPSHLKAWQAVNQQLAQSSSLTTDVQLPADDTETSSESRDQATATAKNIVIN